jgi:orotate phosphoribosyltransferase
VSREIPAADSLVGIAYGGVPIAIAASLASGIPAGMTRKLQAEGDRGIEEQLAAYGQHASVEGLMHEDSRIVLVDDLVTGFDSKLVAARQVELEAARRELSNVMCRDVAVVVDREQGGAESACAHGFSLHSVVKLRSDGLEWLRSMLAPIEYKVVRAYLEDPASFQDPEEQQHLATLAAQARGE